MGLAESGVRYYTYPGGQLLAGAGRADDGSVILGLVFGPNDYWKLDEPLHVFDAMDQF